MTAATTARRPLVLDVDLLFSVTGGLAQRATITALAADSRRFAALVRGGRRGFRAVTAAALATRTAGLSDRDRLATLRAWLLDQGPRPDPDPARPAPTPWWPPRWASLPYGAAVLVAGPSGWSGGRAAFSRFRADLAFVTLADVPPGVERPDYRPEGAPLPQDIAAMLAHSALVIPPDAASEARLRSLASGARVPPVRIAAPPLPAATAPFDEALAAAGFCLVAGPLDAAANTALLLHVWRDLLARGAPMPKLVLAGPRGGQIEEIRPLLDWNETMRRHVAEAPGLSYGATIHLIRHARGVLAPAFAGADGWLAAAVTALGTPLVAADAGGALPAGVVRVPAIDGPGWRRAVLALPPAAHRPPPPAAGDVLAPILARAAAL